MKKREIIEIELSGDEIKTAIVDYLENNYNFEVEINDVKMYCDDEGNIYSHINTIKDILI